MAEAWSAQLAKVWYTPKWKSSEKVVPYPGLRGDTVPSLCHSIPSLILISDLGINLAQFGHGVGSEPHFEKIVTFTSFFISVV